MTRCHLGTKVNGMSNATHQPRTENLPRNQRGTRAAIRARNARWSAANRKKARVESWTRKAISRGILARGPCEVCASEHFVVAHHDDYDQRASVRWLCRLHHQEWHATHGEGANAHTADRFRRTRNTQSPYIGVSRNKKHFWTAEVCVGRTRVWSGFFRSDLDAAHARDAAVLRLGLSRPLNFPKKTEAA